MNLWSGYSSFRQTPVPQMTFVLHDAGETKALAPVMRTLDNLRVDYCILAESTAKILLAGNPHVVSLPQEVAALSRTSPILAGWAQQQLNRALSAGCVMVGMASDFQKNWAQFFQRMGKRVIGYYDGFQYNLQQNRADAFRGCISELVTPSRDTANFFRARFGGIPVFALGQPILDEVPDTTFQAAAQSLRQQLGISPGKPTALFVGGYGPGYEESFTLFCESVKRCSGMNALVAMHPKTDGQLETRMIQAYGLQTCIRMIPKAIETQRVLPICDLVMTQQSTLATQALLQGKKVALLGQVGSAFKKDEFNPLTYYKLAPRCTTPIEVVNWVRRAIPQMQADSAEVAADNARTYSLYALLGIPRQATFNICQFLLARLSGQKNPAQLADGR